MYILESKNAALLDEHQAQKGYSAADGATPAGPDPSTGPGGGSGSAPSTGEYVQYAQQTIGTIDSITGGGTKTGDCVKPHFYAGGAAWKAYNDCLHKNDPPAPSSFVWPSETEFPQNAFENLLASSNKTDTQVVALGEAVKKAVALVAAYKGQTDYHTNVNTDPRHLTYAAGTTIWMNKAADFVRRLSAKILELRPACGVGFHNDSTTGACVADNGSNGQDPHVGQHLENGIWVNDTNWFKTPTGLTVTIGGTVLLIASVCYYGYKKHGWFK